MSLCGFRPYPAQLTDPSDATVKSPSQEDDGIYHPVFLNYSP